MTQAAEVPAEFAAQMRNEPFWPTVEAVAHTLIYDTAIVGLAADQTADSDHGPCTRDRRWGESCVDARRGASGRGGYALCTAPHPGRSDTCHHRSWGAYTDVIWLSILKDTPLKIGVEKSFSWTLVRASAWITGGEIVNSFFSKAHESSLPCFGAWLLSEPGMHPAEIERSGREHLLEMDLLQTTGAGLP